MAATRQLRMTIDKLKKKIKALERKEIQYRKSIKKTAQDARKLAKSYKGQFNKKLHAIKGKHAVHVVKACAKTALDVERQLLTDARRVGKELKSAVVKMDKKHLSRLAKRFAKKARESCVTREAKSAVRKAKPKKARKVSKLKRKVSAVRRSAKRK